MQCISLHSLQTRETRRTLEDQVEDGSTVAECRAVEEVRLAERFADFQAAKGGRDEEACVLCGALGVRRKGMEEYLRSSGEGLVACRNGG